MLFLTNHLSLPLTKTYTFNITIVSRPYTPSLTPHAHQDKSRKGNNI